MDASSGSRELTVNGDRIGWALLKGGKEVSFHKFS